MILLMTEPAGPYRRTGSYFAKQGDELSPRFPGLAATPCRGVGLLVIQNKVRWRAFGRGGGVPPHASLTVFHDHLKQS